jgi:ubiquitin-conjugating enzyme E2 Q
MNALTKVRNEFDNWVTNAETTGMLDFNSISKSEGILILDFCGDKVTITVPDDYPEGEFYVDCSAHPALSEKVNDHVMGKTISATVLFQFIADKIVEMDLLGTGDGDDGSDDFGCVADADPDAEVIDPYEIKVEKTEKVWDDVDAKYQKQTFVHESSSEATRRLISDVKALMRSNSAKNGFTATPTNVNGAENLYVWEVRLFDFEGELGKDMKKYQEKSGRNYVELKIQFSKDYPFMPPFVRVIEPRFMFRTGNVTLGGAICMEMLTLTGWRAVNSIESIIMTVRSQIGSTESGGRLDFSATSSGYTEQEAWTAFYRAAETHHWNTKGLGPQMFPKFS